jgi:hypothetical protein
MFPKLHANRVTVCMEDEDGEVAKVSLYHRDVRLGLVVLNENERDELVAALEAIDYQ